MSLMMASALMLTAMASSSEVTTARFALIVGQNSSDNESTPALRYADDDAVATWRLLNTAGMQTVLLTRLDEDSQRFHGGQHIDDAPTRHNLLEAMEKLRAAMLSSRADGHDTEFFFFYSGHGNVEHGEGYVVLEDGRLKRREFYKQILGRSPATRNHVIVDSCKSYFFAFGKGDGQERQPADMGFSQLAYETPTDNTGFLLSTSSERDSHEWERFQAGIFSHELRSALWGGADVDGDNNVTYAELGAFLESANAKIGNPLYRPDFLVLAPDGSKTTPGSTSPVFLRWEREDALILDDQAWGHIYVEAPSGLRLADVHPAAGQVMTLHLPADRPLFVRRADEQVERVVGLSGTMRLSALTEQQSTVARRGALHLAFQQLFAEPFGREHVERYSLHPARAPQVSTPAMAERDRHGRSIPWAVPRFVLGSVVGVSVGVAVLSAIAASVALSAAVERNLTGSESSQEERHQRNQAIRLLNGLAWAGFGSAVLAAAGATMTMSALAAVEVIRVLFF